MQGEPQNPAQLLRTVDDLLAHGDTKSSNKLLFNSDSQYFFDEAVQDKRGLYCWATAEEAKEGKLGSANCWSPYLRIGHRASAGLHWILSGEDDEIRRTWRKLVLDEFQRDPEKLFAAMRFPELPFDRFTHPAVKSRLTELHEQLRARGFDDEKLRTLLWKPYRAPRRARVEQIGALSSYWWS